MGVTVNLYLIKDETQIGESGFEVILEKLGVQTRLDRKGIDYEEVQKNFWERNPEPLLGMAYFKSHFIIQDDFNLIDASRFHAYTAEFQTTLLQADNSDTVGICSFSYYSNGQLIRRKSFGLDGWADEMQEAGLDVPEGASPGDWDEGEPLGFESNGSAFFELLETYGIGYDKLHELEWELRVVTD
jgi:hypothetical protein